MRRWARLDAIGEVSPANDYAPAVRFGSSLISTLVVLAYTSAALIQCETNSIPSFVRVPVSRSVHAMPAMSSSAERDSGHEGQAHPRAHAARSAGPSHGEHAQGHRKNSAEPSSNAAENAHGDAHGHTRAHADGKADASSPTVRKTSVARSRLELKAVCVCGCSETRGTVGGGTSRLGSVVPAIYLPCLLEADLGLAPLHGPDRVVEFSPDLDPIPI